MSRLRRILKRYFLTGLLVVVPVWGTYLVLRTLLGALEGILGGVLRRFVPFYVPGLGIGVLLILIFAVGVFATNFFGRRIVAWWEQLLRSLPLVRGVYNLVKTVVDTISARGSDGFNRVVLVQFPRKGQYSIGFMTGVTQGEVQRAAPERLVNIFIPTTPNPTTGFLVLVPEDEVVPLQMSVQDGMKMIISGGLYSPPSGNATAGRPAPRRGHGKAPRQGSAPRAEER